MKSNSNVRPPKLLDLGNGSWHYNHKIKEVEVENEKGEIKTVYEYDTVLIWGTPEYEKCVKAVLRDRRAETEEFSLINKYNAFALGLSTDPADETEYKEFLSEVLSVKAMVRADIQEFDGK
jgi:hypothetical protein